MLDPVCGRGAIGEKKRVGTWGSGKGEPRSHETRTTLQDGSKGIFDSSIDRNHT